MLISGKISSGMRAAAPIPSRARRMRRAAMVCGALKAKRTSNMRCGPSVRGGGARTSFVFGVVAGVCVFEYELEVMQSHDGGDDTQPESRAWNESVALGAIEPVQYRCALVAGYARTIVLNYELRPCWILTHSHLHCAAAARELDRVVEQIAYCLEQQLGIGLDYRPRLDDRQQPNAGFLREWRVQIDGRCGDLGQVDQFEPSAPLARLELRDPENGTKAVEDILDPAGDACDILAGDCLRLL